MGALQHCCSYKRCLPELSVQGDVPVSGLVEEEQVGVDSWLLAILKLKQQRYLMTYFEEILSVCQTCIPNYIYLPLHNAPTVCLQITLENPLLFFSLLLIDHVNIYHFKACCFLFVPYPGGWIYRKAE